MISQRKIHQLRVASRPIAFRLFLWAFWIGLAVVLICLFVGGPGPVIAVRVIGVMFAVSLSGMFVYFVLIAVEAWLKRDRVTAVGMCLYLILHGWIMLVGVQVAIHGVRRH